MLISKKHDFIFVHIYKNAGTSIISALLPFAQGRLRREAGRVLKRFAGGTPFYDPQPFPNHATASEMIAAMGVESFRSYFSFAFVRNPWDWRVSLYKYIMKSKRHRKHEFVKGLGSFEEYVRWSCRNRARLQKDFVCSEGGDVLVDFIGRYENLEHDFGTVCSRIGISASLPRLNVSNRRPYREFYSDETRDLVKRAYEPDIEFFGYEF